MVTVTRLCASGSTRAGAGGCVCTPDAVRRTARSLLVDVFTCTILAKSTRYVNVPCCHVGVAFALSARSKLLKGGYERLRAILAVMSSPPQPLPGGPPPAGAPAPARPKCAVM